MDIQGLIDEYAAWLREKITFEKFGEYYEITTPYLDNSNDYLQIYVKQDGEEIYFTDDCATIRSLKASGFNFTQARAWVKLKPLAFRLRMVAQSSVK